ncbi:hypothetical protein G7Y79_00051g086580 [Physcia stellaris]|nr:hypothetical protein G7Y79_00051g086580 [Physcia stellaris]
MTISVKDQSPTVQQRELTRSGHEEHLLLPDLFISFMAPEPRLNPRYEEVKQVSESWIAELCHYDEKSYKKHVAADFPYMVAISARDAEPEEFRTICDWMNWVFDFDDMFDDGYLQKNPEQAKIAVTNLKNVMNVDDPSHMMNAEDPLLKAFASVWHRVAKVSQTQAVAYKPDTFSQRSPEGVRKRFIKYNTDYVDGVLCQVEVVASANQISEEEYMAMRRRSIGAAPCFVFIEYFYGFELPDEVLQHPSIQQLEKLTKEFIIIHNDAVSFPKELALGTDQNLVAFYGRRGLAPQEVYDKLDIMLKARCRQWYLAWADVPQWGETIDQHVQKYIHGLQDLARGNLYWSFRGTRYFGEKTDHVRRTRAITVSSEDLLKNGLALPREKS